MTEPLDLRNQYTGGDYVYLMGGNGTQTNAAGKKLIDCSHMVNLLLTGAGYQIEYEETRAMNASSRFYTVVPPTEVKKGDIALWIDILPLTGGSRRLFHTGIVMEYNAATRQGKIFGAQTTNGPSEAFFGTNPPAYYWPVPTKFLRAKEEYRTGATPAPAPSAAPAPAGPAPLMNFQYPFRKADGKQFADAEEVYKALEAETAGHYLLGSNKFWHGGIHISNASAPQCILNEPIRCMADGEVVAYRLNEDYLESTFGENEKKLKYSNSFCLVRHEYKSAPNPEDGPNKGKQNKLNFYSLYMHLLPFKRYPLTEEETPKPQVTMKVSDFNAYDDFPESSSVQNVGKLVAGTKLEILDQKALGTVTYAKGKILSGSVKKSGHKVRETGKEVWFAYLKDGEPYKNSKPARIWLADPIPERLKPKYWQGKVKGTALTRLDLYQGPISAQNGQNAGDKIGSLQLNPQSSVEFESKEVLNLNVAGTIRRMAKCTSSGSLAGTGNLPPSFWVIVENEYVAWDVIPSSFNSVEPASTGIKAGDPIGYLGLTENLTGEDGGVTNKYQVHVEIFTADVDVENFLQNAADLKIGKQYLHLLAGAELKKKAPATGSIPVKKEHVVDLSKAPVIKEGDESWYDVSVVEDDQPLKGLVKKSGATLITQHDWEKLGFQIVEETNTVADGFLDPQDMPQFFKDLFVKIDKNHDGDVDSNELSEALKNVDMRDHWAKLIAHHPTEWKDKAESVKWSKLDKILEASPKKLKHEKERISKYVFWSELSGKAAVSSDVVWHFHPVEFIKNMTAKKICECNAIVKVTRWNSSTMTHYGPLHTGDKELGSAPQWDELVSAGRITADEKKIIVVMSGNEAKINGVQCYDSEVITAGAMQKTMKVTGGGELPDQIKKFKDQYPDAYVEFFESKGWKLDEAGVSPQLYYQGEARANGAKLEKQALKENLQLGCNEATFGKVIDCQPVSAMACAIASPLYVEIQIMDFIDRLHAALSKVPAGYSFSAEKLFKSPLGKAVVLDHDINRPAFVKDDLGAALDTFFSQNPAVSRNIDTWGAAHGANERKVLDLYGNNRRMTNPSLRYNHLKAGL
ncbi:calcium-binding protein [Pseudomonas sp. B21-051]|uniref:EF-hand domain-containing protein n=1 Tax=unclassified Pseudomonas TaxID=196821 RepID=UPI00048336BD|nr:MULTISPECIES: EF-hand domain-containing protein [unclassified Pseudomonas]UVK88351.1 calcium-binding protein [Pseudomonas sp. B21-051]SNY35924.1 hypothetical protein SAMN05660455_04088 [Pseudomonas sp. LAMO17WK12:I5]SNY36256.1 hypothetical protein SAMN05660659_03898 [Pseudomonas sp. LAMO17WK12:I6]